LQIESTFVMCLIVSISIFIKTEINFFLINSSKEKIVGNWIVQKKVARFRLGVVFFPIGSVTYSIFSDGIEIIFFKIHLIFKWKDISLIRIRKNKIVISIKSKTISLYESDARILEKFMPHFSVDV